jgi:hypothetical protein
MTTKGPARESLHPGRTPVRPTGAGGAGPCAGQVGQVGQSAKRTELHGLSHLERAGLTPEKAPRRLLFRPRRTERSAPLVIDMTGLFQNPCGQCIAIIRIARLLGTTHPPISPLAQQALLLPPLRLLRSLLVGTCSHILVAPLSPRAGPHFVCAACIRCMADMLHLPLPTIPVEFIRGVSLRRVPYPPPSEQVSRHRTGIVSSSLDPGSPIGRISSSLAPCHTFDLASALSTALSPDRAFFCPSERPEGANRSGGAV